MYRLTPDADDATLVAVDTQHRELEAKFYKSLYEEIFPPAYRYPSQMTMPGSATSLMRPMMQPAPMMTYLAMAGRGVPPAMRQNIAMPLAQQTPIAIAPMHNQHPPQQVVMRPTACIPMHQPNNAMVTQPPPSSAHAKNLHQTYMNALNQMMKSNQQPSINGAATVVTNPRLHAAVTPQVPTAPFAAPVPALSHPGHPKDAAKDATATTRTLQQSSEHPVLGMMSAPSSEEPDLLSGFEKVSGDERPQWMMPGAPIFGGFEGYGVPLQCSPPLTSKSFDELHRLLGSDLSPKPFDLNESKSEQYPADSESASTTSDNTTNTATTQHGTATPTNISADVYALFAQQSALAVSQHSAYCRASKVSSQACCIHTTASPVSSPDISFSLATMYEKPKAAGQTSARFISGSEQSSDVEGGSMHGSSSSSNTGTSDTSSNDSDSVSDDGPPQKKAKTGEENENNAREVASPVSSDWSSPRAQ